MSSIVEKSFKLATQKCKAEGREPTFDDVKEAALSLYATEVSVGVDEEFKTESILNGIKIGKSLAYIAEILFIQKDEAKTLLKKKIASLLEISLDQIDAIIEELKE